MVARVPKDEIIISKRGRKGPKRIFFVEKHGKRKTGDYENICLFFGGKT